MDEKKMKRKEKDGEKESKEFMARMGWLFIV